MSTADAGSVPVLIASYLEPEFIERICAVDDRLHVINEPELLPVPRYACDHVGTPRTLTPAQEQRWRDHLAVAEDDAVQKTPPDGRLAEREIVLVDRAIEEIGPEQRPGGRSSSGTWGHLLGGGHPAAPSRRPTWPRQRSGSKRCALPVSGARRRAVRRREECALTRVR